MKPYPRSERVGIKIQAVLSELIRKKIQDPRVELATISSVKVTSDLRIAYVYFSVFGGEERIKEAAAGLQSCHGFIKRQVASQLGLRYMPELKFLHDESFDHGSRIDKLLRSVSKESDPEE
ncbi:MAG: 30S ribosome-binding factor RbfA [Desulfobacteraceae bacterium]|nr:30S ribosome-binding factor RbfA [Desulfobacteraceae bacterium]